MNRAHLLEKTLSSLSMQDMPKEDFEVLIIDNGSTDNTKLVCDSYSSVFANFNYIYDDRPGLHTGRNLGFLKSKSEILVYGDDDITVPENWLTSIIEAFNDPDVYLVGGNDIPDYEQTPPDWINSLWIDDAEGNKLLLPFSCIDMGNAKKIIRANYVFGCNFSIRREILLKTKGFHPDGVPKRYMQFRGDGETFVSEYITEHNLKTLFIPEASVKHFVSKERMTQEYVNGIAFRNGISSRFTKIRKNNSLVTALIDYLHLIFGRSTDNTTKGEKFLLKHYIKSKKLRAWVNLQNYLDVSIYDYL